MSINSIIPQKQAESCEDLRQFSDHVAVITDLVNPDDILRAVRWLHRPGDTFEIRTLESQTDKYAGRSCGYFREFDTAVEAVVEHVGQYRPAQVYISLNPTTPDLYARAKDRIKTQQKAMAKNEDIIRVRNILIDCDPVRPPGIPSSSSELEAARETMETIKAWLCEQGWSVPLVGMSGNGYHLIYAVDLNVDTDSQKLVKDLIEVLATRFDDDVIHLDRSVHNPGRVCKLYGTFPIKGDGADDRVNRMSYIVEYPDRMEVTAEMMQAVIDELRPDVKPVCQKPPCSTSSHRGINLIKFLDNRQISCRNAGNGKFILDQCAFDPGHCNGEVAVFQNPNGSTAYHCFHDSCTGKGWQEFTQIVGRVTKDDWNEPLTSWTTDSTEKITKHIAPASDQRSVNHSAPHFEMIPSQEIARCCGDVKPGYWGNLIQAGMLTLFVGAEKSGKSTFLHTLYRFFSTGGEFIYPVARCKIAVCSEEPKELWSQYHDLNEWRDDTVHVIPCHDFLTLQPCKKRDEFRVAMKTLGAHCVETGISILVFDTFRKLFPLDSYDDAAQIKKVLDPVKTILCHECGLAVVLVHHAKKNAKECSSPTAVSSGSNHLTAEADRVLIFTRTPEGKRNMRRLSIYGRLVQGEYVFEFDELNHIYCPVLGDDSEKYKETNHKIWNLVPHDWTPSTDIIQRAIDIGVKKSTVYSALRVGDQEGYLDSRNAGEKNAKEYRRTEIPIQSMLAAINGQQD